MLRVVARAERQIRIAGDWYYLYTVTVEKQTVTIVAFWHTSRRPPRL